MPSLTPRSQGLAVAAHESLVSVDLQAGRSWQVMAWTVTCVARARELSGMGVAAIISDGPRLIRNGLRE